MAWVPVPIASSGRLPQTSAVSSVEIPLKVSRSAVGQVSPRTDASKPAGDQRSTSHSPERPELIASTHGFSRFKHYSSSIRKANNLIMPSVGVVNAGCQMAGIASPRASSPDFSTTRPKGTGWSVGTQLGSRIRQQTTSGRLVSGGNMQQSKMPPHSQQVLGLSSTGETTFSNLELQIYWTQRDLQLHRNEFRKEVDRLETELRALRQNYRGVESLVDDVHREVRRLAEVIHVAGGKTSHAGQTDAQLLDAPLSAIREEVASALKLVEKERDLLATAKSNELSAKSQADAEILASIQSCLKQHREEICEEQIHYEQRLAADLSAELRDMEDDLRAYWESRHNEAYAKVLNMVATCIETCQQHADAAQLASENHSCEGRCEHGAACAQRLLQPQAEALGNDLLQSIRECGSSEPAACCPGEGPDVKS